MCTVPIFHRKRNPESKDRHKVERVRVNNESNKEKGDYRDVYGSHISPEA